MMQGRTAGVLVLLAVLLTTACATPKQVFMHKWHRQNFAISDDELKTVQFYISTEVLAMDLTPGEKGTPQSVVIVPSETPGMITETGPDWVRVSFQRGGSGVFFATVVTGGGDSAYWLATEVEGRDGLRRMRDLDEKILRVGDAAYRLKHGSNARLLIDGKDLENLIKARTHVPGRTR